MNKSGITSTLMAALALALSGELWGQDSSGKHQPSADEEATNNHVANEDTLVSAASMLRGETLESQAHWLRRRALVNDVLASSSRSAADSLNLSINVYSMPFSLSRSQLDSISPTRDYIQDRLLRDQLQGQPMVNLGSAIGKGLQYLANKVGGRKEAWWAEIPSREEVMILKVLWEKRAATTSEIYAQLDSASLTATDLGAMLENMAERGMLDRKQISPRNEFTILGAFTIETSRRNVRNREFRYWPLVSRSEMITFLDAVRFLDSRASADHRSLSRNLGQLLSLIALGEP